MRSNVINLLSKLKRSRINRNKLGIPSLPLNLEETKELINQINHASKIDNEYLFYKQSELLDLLKNKIVPGVDSTSKMKANFLLDIAESRNKNSFISILDAIDILGTMQGGYSIEALVKLLDSSHAMFAAENLKNNILIFDYFNSIEEKMNKGNPFAKEVIESWAKAEWFFNRDKLPKNIELTCFKVNGEINTDDLSPAQDAFSRPDIPLHSLSMLKCPREGIIPDVPYEKGPIETIEWLKQKGNPIAFVGDVVGTGSSRKSATNSILWHFGKDIPFVPNKRQGGFCFGDKIAPIFFNTMEDSGALPIEMPVNDIKMGQEIILDIENGRTIDKNTNEVICEWKLKCPTILDSVRAGGRINMIIGKALTEKSRESLNMSSSNFFVKKKVIKTNNKGFTLAQKIVGNACGVEGVHPGNYCEPKVTTVGSQDTTGPMTRDELKDLACLGFSADLVMQSFCHTAAYPKDIDIITHNTLPDFMHDRGGVSLRPKDGIIHSWLNRMLLPDTVGTGGDSHTRFPIGISFPAGSGLVAFASATGVMPLDMPESVLVKFKGTMQPGITLRDLVHSIPYYAEKNNLLTLDKKNKKNIFSGNILEIEGLPNLTCEQAFELSDASAERSAAGCTIKLNKEPIIEYLQSNISLLNWMIKEGYNDKKTIERRIKKMNDWIENPELLEADDNAEYKAIIEINLDEIKEPILCAPNDPDKTVLLSDVSGEKIDEVFIGSCMTNIGHFRAAGKLLNNNETISKLWMAPPTKMDELQLKKEGYYDIYKKSGVRTEVPGCSLCMGNQARVNDKSTVLSTSTRNFPNRLGKDANVYLASAELSAITSLEGKIPDMKTYLDYFKKIDSDKENIFKYLNFNKIKDYN
tara:strand:+ start:7721 stop:10315 length:2595 start_codon:yes stop_codon:yes gene_type:complete